MHDSVKGFIERQNIAHYIDQLKTEADPVRRDMLRKLLAEEEAKLLESAYLDATVTRSRHRH